MSVNSVNFNSEESGLSAVRAQEQRAEKPTLNASPGLGNWLEQMGGSLAFTTYQSARLFLLFAGDDGRTLSQERIMGTAMGLAADDQGLWVSNQQQVWRLANIGPQTLGESKFDAVYMPRRGYLLGGCDVHDLLANVSHQGQQHELLFGSTRALASYRPIPLFHTKNNYSATPVQRFLKRKPLRSARVRCNPLHRSRHGIF